eukprot:SAG11_NODE_24830_length_367_cov_1.156716_2_plen_60_part_01
MQGLPEQCLDVIAPLEYATCAAEEVDSWHRWPLGDAMPELNRSLQLFTRSVEQRSKVVPI